MLALRHWFAQYQSQFRATKVNVSSCWFRGDQGGDKEKPLGENLNLLRENSGTPFF